MVFASPSSKFYLDVTNSYHLSGLSHLDNFIMTRKSCPLTGTLQKRMPTPTQTATPYTAGPLAAMQIYPSPHYTWTAAAQARVLQPFPLPCEIMLEVNNLNILNYFTG
jgi:hypothetical protein